MVSKTAKAILILGIVLLAFGVFAAVASEQPIDDEQPIEPGPPQTTVVTVTQTQAPQTTVEPEPTQPQLVYTGKTYAFGRMGFYDSAGNAVKLKQFDFATEGKTISYFESEINVIELYGGSGLNPDSMVVYLRTKIRQGSNAFVKLTDDILLYKGNFHLNGYGVDNIQSHNFNKWDSLDLSDHWSGWFDPIKMNKPTRQRVYLAPLFRKAGVSTYGRYNFDIVHETIFELKNVDGALYSAVSRQTMNVELLWYPERIALSSVGTGGIISISMLVVIVVVVGVGFLLLQRSPQYQLGKFLQKRLK